MMRFAQFATAFFLLLPVLSRAQNHVHQDVKPSDATPITITLNPESRVSVVLSGPLPPPTQCGALTTIPIKVINQSFATVRLEASLASDASSSGVAIDFRPEPLNGTPEEFRSLGIRLSHSDPVDITLSFGAHHVAHDLGGRDRTHFMMRCVPLT